MPKFPDRWFDYTNVGDVVQGTRLITFKVPLKESFFAYNNRIPADSRFTPTTLLECMRGRGLKLGLVIDLTYTDRYYDPEEFKRKGVQYKKIFVEGHVIPTQEVMESFYEAIDRFLETSEEDSLIGVHCTHGVNRTGYVVCRYMVEHLGMKATEALEAYKKARGYSVERINYINDLKDRAGEPYEKEKETSDTHEGSSSRDRGHAHSSHHHRGRGRGHYHNNNRGYHQGGWNENYGHHNGRQNEHFDRHQNGADSGNWRNPNNQFHASGAYGWAGNQFDPNACYGYRNEYGGNYGPNQPYSDGAWNNYGSPHPPYRNSYNQGWGRGAYQGSPNGYGPHIQSNGYSDYNCGNNSYDRRSYNRQNSDSRREGRGNRGGSRQRPF
ncbi:RNA/RNP complex-1-interacting phosphatase-like [Mercenaria mercenaria]|uniref:RNA/RNP complex-1-interacting phosphatase-like n=1 Tax=Mercenaria mercenaria TaxID=6596 RepID=UPI00234F8CBE|nr:RNA/RNP complex-1-interacting phosphatase-like [Mercenaria mercenaria]